MAFTSAARASLVEKLRIKAGISDTDSRFQVPAIVLHETQSQNTSSSTVEVKSGSLVLVGNSSGTDTVTFSADETLDEVVTAIGTAATGVEAVRIAPDGDEPSTNLLTIPATDILNDDLTLYAFSTLLLDQLVDEALARAEAVCRTKLFDDGTPIERTLWREGQHVVLDDAPVNRLDYFSVDSEDAFRVTYTGTGVGTIEVTEDTVIVRTRTSGSSVTETEISITAQDGDVSDIVSTINGLTGWTATTLNDGRTDVLVRMPSERATSEPVTVERWVEGDDQYRLDRRAGIIHMDSLVLDRWYAGQRIGGQLYIQYEAGYTTLPPDLEGLILNAAKAGLDAMGQTAGLASEKLGDYSYTLAPGASSSAAMDDAIMSQSATLGRYTRRLP